LYIKLVSAIRDKYIRFLLIPQLHTFCYVKSEVSQEVLAKPTTRPYASAVDDENGYCGSRYKFHASTRLLFELLHGRVVKHVPSGRREETTEGL
jgi:hypothetical protein